eukprot:c8228_g1_i1.p1 GENE.c8228_g1_i1~~c8228_g1_i1.p1  ORF type:complete len:143 (+),score=30.55 c8228_g1_i1:53-481(+)
MYLDEWKKIGVFLTALGLFFMFLGVLMFMDKGLIAMGNLMFLVGTILILGVSNTVSFLSQKRKLRGTVCFLGGVFLVLARWPIIGILVEAFGFINLFGNFFPIIIETLRRLPLIGSFFNIPVVFKLTDIILRGIRNGPDRPV